MCGKDLGGIWVDGANESKTYIPVFCNSQHKLLSDEESHYYFDKKSGAAIFFSIKPSVIVDERGCVKDV